MLKAVLKAVLSSDAGVSPRPLAALARGALQSLFEPLSQVLRAARVVTGGLEVARRWRRRCQSLEVQLGVTLITTHNHL